MLVQRAFWHFMMAATITVWGLILFLGFELLPQYKVLFIVVFFALLLTHASEILLAKRIGLPLGLSPVKIAIMTTIFGFTWWIPLRMGIIE